MVPEIRGGLGCMAAQGKRCQLNAMTNEMLKYEKYSDRSDRGLILM